MLVNPVHCSLLHPVPQDVRRLVVAMSRARLGLYIFGRFELFNNCYELQPTFKQLAARPLKLQLLPQERFGAVQRLVDARGTGMQTIGACGCGCRCCCTSCTGTLEELAQLVGELLGAWSRRTCRRCTTHSRWWSRLRWRIRMTMLWGRLCQWMIRMKTVLDA